MASNHGKVLFNAESLTASTTTAAQELQSKDINFIGFLKSTNASSANYAVVIEHSPNGDDWFTLITFTAVTGNVIEKIAVDNTTNHVFEHVRCVATRTTGSVDLTIVLNYDRS